MRAYGRRLLLRDTSRAVSHVYARQASLTGAINRGIRKTQRGVETAFEGVRNKRSEDSREKAPWQVKTERRLGGKAERERGWRGDVEQYSHEQRRSSRDDSDVDRSSSRTRGPDNRDGLGGDGRERGGGGFNRDNADRRVRYEERKAGSRERGPLPNRDGPNREERRRALFGQPYSGQPQHDKDFMDGHIKTDRQTHTSRTARASGANRLYEEQNEERENDFSEDYTKAEKGGWSAEDVEKEWSGRKPSFQPEFTRPRDLRSMNREARGNQTSRSGGREDEQSSLDRYGSNRDIPQGAARETSQDSFRKSQPSGDHYVPEEERNSNRRQKARTEDTEDFDSEVEMPSLEQRRNKFRPARKLERSLVDVDTTSKILTTAPAAVPYTTAASIFLWGTFSVQEAIRAGRRTLHTLYIYRGQSIEAPTTPESYQLISKLALSRGCNIKEISGEGWSRLLNKMTASRPHNGWVLEASEIPKLPVTSFLPMEGPSKTFSVKLGHQTAEDLAINAPIMDPGSSPNSGVASIPSAGQQNRFPLVLLLDRIMDPGNLGAIVRSAYFLGVDALLVLEHSTAPFNAIMLKVAAGAAEYLPILMVKNEHDLVKSSRLNGWKFFAAISPDAVPRSGTANQKNNDVSAALSKGPCVLMLGSEGEGLRPHLQKLADGVASVKNARGQNAGVDSLNVSVASALLCQEFLRGPHKAVAVEGRKVEDPATSEDVSLNENIKKIGVGESEEEMVERQDDKIF